MQKEFIHKVILKCFNSGSQPYKRQSGRGAEQRPLSLTLADGGFTLIELLVVVLIIGILAAVAFPKYQMAVYKTRFIKVMPLVNHYRDLEEAYYMANGRYGRLEDIGAEFPAGCVYNRHSDWVYDTLDCPDYRISYTQYNSIRGYVNRCPAYSWNASCIVYNLPLSHHHSLVGEGPSCLVERIGGSYEEYGKKVCRMISGKDGVSVGAGTAYYLR